MPNRIQAALSKTDTLNVYYTAGFPELEDTRRILLALQKGGADMVELGMPYSDPLADGTTIQESSSVAINNGMTLSTLFDQLDGFRSEIELPVFLMGYLNPVMQFGLESFFRRAHEVGVDGLILPDVPMEMYEETIEPLCSQYGLAFVFLVTPETSEERIRKIDERATGFIYMVSSSSTTGSTSGMGSEQVNYFERIQAMNLSSPTMIGFGISERSAYQVANQYADGAIIGSAFIRQLREASDDDAIQSFIQSIKS